MYNRHAEAARQRPRRDPPTTAARQRRSLLSRAATPTQQTSRQEDPQGSASPLSGQESKNSTASTAAPSNTGCGKQGCDGTERKQQQGACPCPAGASLRGLSRGWRRHCGPFCTCSPDRDALHCHLSLACFHRQKMTPTHTTRKDPVHLLLSAKAGATQPGQLLAGKVRPEQQAATASHQRSGTHKQRLLQSRQQPHRPQPSCQRDSCPSLAMCIWRQLCCKLPPK